MKRIFTLLIITAQIWAYDVGDRVDKVILVQLGIDDANVTMVDFFASWCEGCRHELPQIEALSKSGISVRGVNVDEDVAKGRAFQKALGLTFPVIDDPKGEIIGKFDPVGMPALFIIKAGRVSGKIIGAREDIGKLVREKLAH